MSKLRKMVTLKECSEVITKGTTPSTIGEKFISSGIKFIKSESICDSKYLNSNVFQFIDEETDYKLKRSRLIEGDILFSIAGAYLGKIGIVRDIDLPANTNQAVGIVRLKRDVINSDFVYYYFSQKHINSYINKLSSQSSQPNLNLDLLGKLEFEFKDLSTQQKIASALSSLDAKIELNNRINTELEAMAKTLYDYWFVQFDFPDAEGKPYKSSGGAMVWSEELKREIPLGWEVGNLSSLANIIGGSTPSREDITNFSDNGIAWITPKDLSINAGKKFITKGEIDVSEKGLKTASLNIMPEGSVLLSSRAPIGYMAIARGEVTTNQGFKSFVPKSGFSTPFVYYTVKDLIPSIEAKSSGSTFKEVSASVLKSIETFLPPESVIENFTEKVAPIFEKQDKIEQENQQLAQLRDWLLPMLMNGQVVVE
jgi:type I restriction enzyme, S subunit